MNYYQSHDHSRASLEDLAQLQQICLRDVEFLIIHDSTQNEWAALPPISWYERRSIKPPFYYLPDSIGNLTQLRSLIIVNLDLKSLPSSITNLKNLEYLDVSLNKLDLTLEMQKFYELPNLKHLRVFGNHFDEEVMLKFKERFPNVILEYNSESLVKE